MENKFFGKSLKSKMCQMGHFYVDLEWPDGNDLKSCLNKSLWCMIMRFLRSWQVIYRSNLKYHMGHISRKYGLFGSFIPKNFPWPRNIKKKNAHRKIFPKISKFASKTFWGRVLTDIPWQDLPELISVNFGSIFRIVGYFFDTLEAQS